MAGQVVVPILVAAREKTLDLDMYNNPRDLEAPDEPADEPRVPLQKTGDREPVTV
ncbi:hypothetical protein [Streptomyces sp. SID3343]|uniref:hypothetical protein n=1 Tax=Streptomyces sp. SID3343 TaxID=2690260 RepID=UPI001F38E3A0|nr:hypothetical protein [Streptomyces sp. SID3343]